MPYLSKEDCAKLIRDCSIFINESGIFYFSAMEGEYSQSGYETSSDGHHRVYIYYHQADYLSGLLRENGFELIEFLRRDYHKSDGVVLVDMVFIGRKRIWGSESDGDE